MHEPARRFRVSGVSPFEESSEIDYRKKLHLFLNTMEANTIPNIQIAKTDSTFKKIDTEEDFKKLVGQKNRT